jgi:hypothetical protein
MYSATAKVMSIRTSNFPGIVEVELRNPREKLTFRVELPREVITFSTQDQLRLSFSKSQRTAKRGLQLQVFGKVIRLQEGDPKVLRMSFYGLQAWLTVPKKRKIDFSAMDEIYFSAHQV